MQKHEIPRESKNEGKILYIFDGRSIITTVIGIVIGLIIGIFVSAFFPTYGMLISAILFGVLGFLLGTIKIPEITNIPVTKLVSGMYVDEAIMKYIKFKKRRSLKILEKED